MDSVKVSFFLSLFVKLNGMERTPTQMRSRLFCLIYVCFGGWTCDFAGNFEKFILEDSGRLECGFFSFGFAQGGGTCKSTGRSKANTGILRFAQNDDGKW